MAQAILNAVSGDLAENQSAFTSVGSSVGPIARRTNCTMAVPWLSAIGAAPNERDIASGATVEFKYVSAFTSPKVRYEPVMKTRLLA